MRRVGSVYPLDKTWKSSRGGKFRGETVCDGWQEWMYWGQNRGGSDRNVWVSGVSDMWKNTWIVSISKCVLLIHTLSIKVFIILHGRDIGKIRYSGAWYICYGKKEYDS